MRSSSARRTATAIALAALLPLAAHGAPPTGAAGTAATPVASPAGAPGARCGNHLLEPGEACDSCPADCAAASCERKGRRSATVALAPQPGYEAAGAVTVLLAYRTDRLAMPGSGGGPEVSARLRALQPGAQLFANDLGHAIRVVASSGDGLPPGPLFEIALDACAGAPAPSAADLSCRIEACAAGGVPLTDCACTVTLHSGGPTP